MFAVVLLTVGCFALPSFAQQQDLQEVMNATNALASRENELLGKKDAAVMIKDKAIQGNWFRILKREGGAWKIAMEAFGRAGAIDASPPAAASSSTTPANSK